MHFVEKKRKEFLIADFRGQKCRYKNTPTKNDRRLCADCQLQVKNVCSKIGVRCGQDRREADDLEVKKMEEKLLEMVRGAADPLGAMLLAIDVIRLSLALLETEKETPG